MDAVFPPKSEWDVLAYADDEVVAGYREYRPDDPMPGANRDSGYQWGWANRKRDMTKEADGFEAIRAAFCRLTTRPQ